MNATDEIIDCPFCGSPAELWHSSTWDYEVRCTDANCKAKTRRYHENYTGAILAWNSRYEKTCHVEDANRVWQSCNVWTFSLSCGHLAKHVGDAIPPDYCPICGAKVKR